MASKCRRKTSICVNDLLNDLSGVQKIQMRSFFGRVRFFRIIFNEIHVSFHFVLFFFAHSPHSPCVLKIPKGNTCLCMFLVRRVVNVITT